MTLLSHHLFEGERFRGLSLVEATVEETTFDECSFTDVAFVECALKSCRFMDCTFLRCNFSMTTVEGSRFSGASFRESRFIALDWTVAQWNAGLVVPLSFERCMLKHVTFLGLEMEAWRFIDSEVIDVDFREGCLRRADFSGTDLRESLFNNTDLREADFSKARNYRIAAAQNDVAGTRFSLPEAMALLDDLGIVLTDRLT